MRPAFLFASSRSSRSSPLSDLPKLALARRSTATSTMSTSPSRPRASTSTSRRSQSCSTSWRRARTAAGVGRSRPSRCSGCASRPRRRGASALSRSCQSLSLNRALTSNTAPQRRQEVPVRARLWRLGRDRHGLDDCRAVPGQAPPHRCVLLSSLLLLRAMLTLSYASQGSSRRRSWCARSSSEASSASLRPSFPPTLLILMILQGTTAMKSSCACRACASTRESEPRIQLLLLERRVARTCSWRGSSLPVHRREHVSTRLPIESQQEKSAPVERKASLGSSSSSSAGSHGPPAYKRVRYRSPPSGDVYTSRAPCGSPPARQKTRQMSKRKRSSRRVHGPPLSARWPRHVVDLAHRLRALSESRSTDGQPQKAQEQALVAVDAGEEGRAQSYSVKHKSSEGAIQLCIAFALM